jgi:hypothetical protein
LQNQLQYELYQHLVRYISGNESLYSFRQWYDAATWDNEVWESDLASQLELLLAEFSSGHRTEAELKDVLSEAITHAIIPIELFKPGTVSVVTTGSANPAAIKFSVAAATLGQLAGKIREVERAS